MAYWPYRGASFLKPFNEVPHLFAVMNDPCPDGHCLLFMVSSIKAGRRYDGTCILEAGEHEFIKWPSYVVYRLGETVSARHVGNMVDRQYYTCKADIDVPLLERIEDGIWSSKEIKPRIQRYADNFVG